MTTASMKLNASSALLLQRAVEAGITSPKELANIMGNAHVETGGFSTMHERFNYKSTERVVAVVPSTQRRFSREQIDEAVASQDPEKVATILYERRRELGNIKEGDGWRFHGRGYFQYTGRDNYARFGKKFGVDLEAHPDLAADPETAAQLALAYWHLKVPVEARENVESAALIINGGENGLKARVMASERWLTLITPQVVKNIQDAAISSQIAMVRVASHERGQPTPRTGANRVDSGPISPHHSHGDLHVLELQRALNHLGYIGAQGHRLEVDGSFGNNTHHAIKAFQHAHRLHPDGIVGKHTLAALEHARHAPLLSEATHPQHGLYVQALHGVRALPGQTFASAHEQNNAAATLTVAAHAAGLRRIDHVVLGTDAVRLFAVEGRMEDPAHRRVDVDRMQAITQTVEQTRTMERAAVQQPMHSHAAFVAMQEQVDHHGASVGIRP